MEPTIFIQVYITRGTVGLLLPWARMYSSVKVVYRKERGLNRGHSNAGYGIRTNRYVVTIPERDLLQEYQASWPLGMIDPWGR